MPGHSSGLRNVTDAGAADAGRPGQRCRERGVGPVAFLESVDNGLRLLLFVANTARVSVSEAAAELGVAPSTAHRLLATLRYRGFVVQGRDRTYRPGPAMEELVTARILRANLAAIALPHLQRLRDETDETTHAMVLMGRQVRVIASCESTQVLRVGIRDGAMLPAHYASAGRMLLSALPPEQFDAAYPKEGVPQAGLTASAVAGLRRDLAVCRKTGYAVNAGQTERGLTAVGVLVTGADGPVGGISVSLPSVRYHKDNLAGLVAALHRAADAISAELH